MKRSKSNCIPPCFRWNVLVFFISGFLFCWCSNRFSFGATSFSVILQSRTADWGPLDGSLERWAYQPQEVPGRDAVRLWGLLSQRKTKDKTVALDRSCVSRSPFEFVSFSNTCVGSFSLQHFSLIWLILHSRLADWGPLDGSLDQWLCQPQDVPGRDAVRLGEFFSSEKRKTRRSFWTEVVSLDVVFEY